MSNKIKVYNPQKFDVGVVTPDKQGGFNIPAGSFMFMTEDDIEYVMSRSKLFQLGYLREQEGSTIVADSGIDVANDANFLDDTEIRKKLSLTPKKLGEWLNSDMASHTLDRIYDVAMSMDLPMTKLKLLNERMPDRNILGD